MLWPFGENNILYTSLSRKYDEDQSTSVNIHKEEKLMAATYAFILAEIDVPLNLILM